MGLDMYLRAENNETGEVEDVGYWRKANAVHGWFVRECANGVDECQPIPVSREQLQKLRQDCNNSLADSDKAVISQPADATYTLDENNQPQSGMDFVKLIQEHMEAQMALKGTTIESNDPLAPTAGFFFGSTEKDQYYYQDLTETIDIIDTALGLSDDWEIIYQASW